MCIFTFSCLITKISASFKVNNIGLNPLRRGVPSTVATVLLKTTFIQPTLNRRCSPVDARARSAALRCGGEERARLSHARREDTTAAAEPVARRPRQGGGAAGRRGPVKLTRPWPRRSSRPPPAGNTRSKAGVKHIGTQLHRIHEKVQCGLFEYRAIEWTNRHMCSGVWYVFPLGLRTSLTERLEG